MRSYEVSGLTHDSYYSTLFKKSPPKEFSIRVVASSKSEAEYKARSRMLREVRRMPQILNVEEPKWFESNLVAFDVETTGLDPVEGRIVEIGFSEYILEKRKFGNPKTFLLNEGVPISPSAEKIHGISNESIKDAPSFSNISEEIKALIPDGTILISHNRGFDSSFLFETAARSGLDLDVNVICSMELALKTEIEGKKNNKLGDLADLLGVEGVNSHRAGDDAQLCGDVFLALARRNPFFRTASVEALLRYFDDIKGFHGR